MHESTLVLTGQLVGVTVATYRRRNRRRTPSQVQQDVCTDGPCQHQHVRAPLVGLRRRCRSMGGRDPQWLSRLDSCRAADLLVGDSCSSPCAASRLAAQAAPSTPTLAAGKCAGLCARENARAECDVGAEVWWHRLLPFSLAPGGIRVRPGAAAKVLQRAPGSGQRRTAVHSNHRGLRSRWH